MFVTRVIIFEYKLCLIS